MNIFNECWFKDCHHMALLPIVKEFLGTFDDLILNQVYFYKEKEFGDLEIKRIDFRNIYEILEEKGIECHVFSTRDILSILKQYLDKDSYAIIGVDNFFESIRKDYYKKKHIAHSLLIKNLEYDEKKVVVLEQPTFFSTDYQLYELTFNELINAYLNFVDRKENSNFYVKKLSDICKFQDNIPNISIFSKKIFKKNNDDISKDIFLKEIFLYKENIFRGIEYIEVYREKIDLLVKKRIHMNENENEIFINSMTDIILGKKEELAAIRRILSCELEKKYIKNQNQIISNWSIIRNKFSRMIYRKQKNDQYIVDINNLLQNIYIREKDNYNIIF